MMVVKDCAVTLPFSVANRESTATFYLLYNQVYAIIMQALPMLIFRILLHLEFKSHVNKIISAQIHEFQPVSILKEALVMFFVLNIS